MIDLGSDAFSTPTDEMREVMTKAEIGCDLMKEDPTVNKLQGIVASVTGRCIYRSFSEQFDPTTRTVTNRQYSKSLRLLSHR